MRRVVSGLKGLHGEVHTPALFVCAEAASAVILMARVRGRTTMVPFPSSVMFGLLQRPPVVGRKSLGMSAFAIPLVVPCTGTLLTSMPSTKQYSYAWTRFKHIKVARLYMDGFLRITEGDFQNRYLYGDGGVHFDAYFTKRIKYFQEILNLKLHWAPSHLA